MTVTASAPGRINLIGEHTDYNLGFAMPVALEARTEVTFEPDGSDRIVLRSTEEGDGASFSLWAKPGDVDGWAAYPAGVVWALARAGVPVLGGMMTVHSDVPIGAGLSSSAALECAVLLAMNSATGTSMNLLDAARTAQLAENDFVGAPTGLMDQLASLNGRTDAAMLIDFQDSSVTHVDFGLDELALVVVDSNAAHQHSTGEYRSRREACTRAARALGVDTLRDIQGQDVLGRIPDATDRRRARHILTENDRVLECARALGERDFETVGRLMTESHASMRDDFEITTPHIDLIAELLVENGGLGARMTGGGFGGCVIALVPTGDVADVSAAVASGIGVGGYPEPTIFTARAGDGARVEVKAG